MSAALFCSTIIPTVGRLTLARAVQSVLAQEGDVPHEVIVVNDGERPLAPAGWQQDERVRVLHTRQRERSVARNSGAAVARGRYLHFLDDDDWLLPGALAAFAGVGDEGDGAWLVGGYQFVDGAGTVRQTTQPDEQGNVLVRLLAGEWLPLQASLIAQEAFFQAGGFVPTLTMFEDNDLARQLMLTGELATVPALVAAIVRDAATTTSAYETLQASNHWSRERLLERHGVWGRLRHSARGRAVQPGYWYGRIASAYLSSALWNGRRGRWARVCSRLLWAEVTLLSAGRWAFSGDFWRGVTRSHHTEGFFVQQGVRS